VRLTTAESALMRLLARQAGEPVSRSDLLAEVGGGEEPSAQERAIDVQVTRLRRKIEENPRVPRYLQTVRGAGYMLAPD
jgi:two-component system phosphate regulon response regulator OmpR